MINTERGGEFWTSEDITVLQSFESNRTLFARATRELFRGLYRKYFQGDEKVLEIGSGIGFLKRHFPNHQGTWIQLDAESTFLREAQRKHPQGVYMTASAYKLPFSDKSVDVVIGFNAYDNFFDLEPAMKEAARVLKQGGLFLHMMDLKPNTEVLEAYLREKNFSDGTGNDSHKYFSERLASTASLYFRPETIEKLGFLAVEAGKRTEQQRQEGAFLFANFAGNFHMGRSAVAHNFESLSVPKLPKIFRPYEIVSQLLEKKFPAIKIIEPPCLEVAAIFYVLARK